MAAPYEIWQTHQLLQAMRAKKAENWYFQQFFTPDRTMLVEDEYIDLEKLPLEGRKLAPFVLPLGRGDSVYDDSVKTYRFKPAYVIVEEEVSPLDGLSVTAGIDPSILDTRRQLSVLERRRILKALKAQAARKAVERRWEWLRSKAVIDGKVTVTYKSGESVLVDFQRDAAFTEVLAGGSRWGDAGVSIMDHIQRVCDSMNDADFGGLPTRMTCGGDVWAVLRKDQEIRDNMDGYRPVGGVSIERGVTAGADGSKVFKVGDISIGGGSGQNIEIWVNNETYDAGTRYLGAKDVVFTAGAEAIQGYSCFGRIIDQDADYAALPIFPKNFTTGDDVKTEHMSFKSAPLMVPIHPDATYKATVVA
jgi:hypothetical protein